MTEEDLVKRIFDVLGHEIRRQIISLLYTRIELTYTELLNTLNIGDGLLNFHLKKLTDFIKKTDKGTYILTEHGKLAYKLIKMATVETSMDSPSVASVDGEIFLRRIGAFLIDTIVFFIFSGVFLDPKLWEVVMPTIRHLMSIIDLHPWILHPEHLTLFSEGIFRLVGVYSHIFFAVYIFITLLEAYKGQTPGKYVLKIRVVKIGGLRLNLIESAIRNAGKVFLLPLDLIVGIIFLRKRGFIRFFDYYTDSIIEKVY